MTTGVFLFHRQLVLDIAQLPCSHHPSPFCHRVQVQSPFRALEARFLVLEPAATLLEAAAIVMWEITLCTSGARGER